MQDIIDFLRKRKEQYIERVEALQKQEESIKRVISADKKTYGEIPGHPKIIIQDEHVRQRLQSVLSKQNELLAKVEFIEELCRSIGDDLISRRAVIKEINNLMQSPYANSPQFGKERKEVLETVKDTCISNIPTAFDLESLMEKFEETVIQELGIDKTQFNLDKKEYSDIYSLSLNNVTKILESAANGALKND